MNDMTAIILAAGRGTRMESDVPKVLHKILGKPIISHVLDNVKAAGISKIIVVAGYGSGELKRVLPNGVKVVIQKKLLGSGDAVETAKKALGRYSGDILVICGDTPLIQSRTIKSIVEKHVSSGAIATVLTARLKDPGSYGRIMRSTGGGVAGIMEEEGSRVHSGEAVNEINVGTYCFRAKDLFEALAKLKPDNRKKEFFLTDVMGILHNKGSRIESVSAKDSSEIIGINTRKDLAQASATLKNTILGDLMLGGVTIEDPSSTTIYPGVKIGRDTVIYPNTLIESDVEIGAGCRVGPFARLRKGVRLGDHVEIGNFVELVRTKIGSNSKAKHHAYLGDAVVGKKVNIGAGTITANYDGKNKSMTVIGDGAFVGVGSILIAPVRIGRLAGTGAGAVVPKNHNVPAGATVVGVPARIFKARSGKERRQQKK